MKLMLWQGKFNLISLLKQEESLQLMTNYYNSKFSWMFKPSLKRSELTTTTTANSNKGWQISQTMREDTPRRDLMRNQQSSLIVPPTLFSNQTTMNKEPIFAPLNYEWCNYPKNALEMINNQPLGDFIVRDIGNYEDLFWFFNGHQIILWQESTNLSKHFQMPQKSEIVGFGELESSSLHFKSKKPIIMVAGCQNYIHLFGLNRETLACEDFKCCYQIANSGYIQKISFFKKNQIVVVSDTGQHWLLDFNSQFKIHRQNGTFLKKALPSFPLLFSQSNYFYEKVEVSNNYIISLVREERKANWFSHKAKQIVSSLFGESNNMEWIIEQKKIQIYSVDRSSKNITLLHKIKENQLLRKCKVNFIDNSQEENQSKIVSINLKGDSSNILEIAIKSGLFIQIDLEKDLCLHNQPLVIPSHNIVGTTGFFLPKKIASNCLIDQANSPKVYSSLGSDNLTLLEDSLCFISENSIEIVKNGGFQGIISQRKHSLIQNRSWLLLTNKGFFKIKRLCPKEVIIGFISERDKLNTKNLSKRWMDQSHFQLFFENLSNSIGPEKVVQSLIELLIQEKDCVNINHDLTSFISKDLQGIPAVSVRDWSYELSISPNKSEEIIPLTNKIRDQVWNLIINTANKNSKSQPLEFINTNKVSSAYWQALKSIFEKLTKPIIQIQPKDVKLNLSKIKAVQKLLKELCSFFRSKGEKETRLSHQLYILRKEQKEEKEDFVSYFKRKKYLEPPNKKLEESTQTQAQTLSSHKFVTQSSKALENDILQASEKINALIGVFLILSDVSESEKLPSLAKVFKSKEAQRKMKAKLIEKLTDKGKLEEFSKSLPELQLFKDIRLLQWVQNSKKYKFLDMFNLQEISLWLSSTYFKKVLGVFSERLDLQIDLLLHYWARTSASISLSSHLFELENKRNTNYTADLKTSLNENIQYCNNEQKIITNELQIMISKTISNYINSEEENYQRAESALNRTIELIASRGDEMINSYLYSELAKTKVTEKIILFKKLKKKPVPAISIEERLMNREVGKRRNQALLSTMNMSRMFEILTEQRQN